MLPSLGYEDGEKMPFSDLLRIVKNIQSKISIPLTVDIEGGYGKNTSEIIKNIVSLYKLGIVGLNIEDSLTNSERNMVSTLEFGKIIQEIKSHLSNNSMDIFLNVRTDFYILGLANPLVETLKRIKIYEESGADGSFVPCIIAENEIQQIVKSTTLPINVMCMPGLSDFITLSKLGVKRISFGPFLYNNMIDKLEKNIIEITQKESFNPLFV